MISLPAMADRSFHSTSYLDRTVHSRNDMHNMLSNIFILLACSFVCTVTAAFHGRTLGAAAYRSSLKTRSRTYELSNEADLVYTERKCPSSI